jgi:hypothetical protein
MRNAKMQMQHSVAQGSTSLGGLGCKNLFYSAIGSSFYNDTKCCFQKEEESFSFIITSLVLAHKSEQFGKRRIEIKA